MNKLKKQRDANELICVFYMDADSIYNEKSHFDKLLKAGSIGEEK